MKFISFYTEDYTQDAEFLKKSLENYGIDSSNVEYRERVGLWEANTQMKAEFILEKLRENDAVVWTDADSRILQNPSFFDTITTDVGLFFLPIELSDGFVPPEYSILKNPDSYLQSGTMYFKNNERVIKLLEDWIELNKRDSQQWDQWTLQVILQNSDVTITQLPPEYVWTWFVAKFYPNREPVIKHTQASERSKNKKTTFITTFSHKGYETHGKHWIESFIKNTYNVYAVIFVDFDLKISDKRINVLNFNECIPTHKDWINSYISLNKNKQQEKDGIKFSYKAFVMMYALKHLSEYVVWLDSDCVFKDNTYYNFAEKTLDNKFIAVQVDKADVVNEIWKSENHVESGIVVFDTEHQDKHKFLGEFEKLYEPYNVAQMELPYDGFIIMRSCKELDFVDLFPSDYTIKSISPYDTFIHPEVKQRFTHYIGADVRRIKTYIDLKGRVWKQPGIPKWIFRFGNESVENLHPKVIEIYEKQLKENPEYELFYFDTKDKLQFAQDFGDPRVEATYNKLVPPAFKCDFLKFVLLYTYGGVYMDYSMEPLIPLKDLFKGYKRILARDSPAPDGMCIGFITSEKGDELMREAMEKCIYNTNHNLYGVHILDITGPLMFSRVYKKLNQVNQIPIGIVSSDLYFYDMADALNIYDNGVPVIRLRMENHHKVLYNHQYDEDSPDNLHYHILYPKGKVFSRKINTYKDLKGKVWQEDGIPKWIFKTGPFEVNDLPEVYKHIFLDMLDKNPSYELFYFSDADCEQFIKDNYDEKYIKAYDTLIPTAYKADLWRTLLLYKYGGCYGDFSQAMLVSFDTIIEGMDRVLVLDTPASTNSLYNAFMCTKSGDDVLQRTIDYIMDNIDRRYYGIDTLDVTGPRVLGRAYCQVVYKNSRFSIPVAKRNKTNILNNPHESNMFIVDSNGTPMILKKLNNHWNIVYNDRGVKHYGELWHAGKVFK